MRAVFAFFCRPGMVAFSSTCTILAVPLSIYLYVIGQGSRRLTYLVDGAATQIVKTGQSTGLGVSFNGQPLTSDVSANQVVLWNAGQVPIKKDEVLKPVVLAMDGGASILEATLNNRSRDVTEAALDTHEIAKGRLGIDWRILEHDDGLRLQVIYAGPPSTKIGFEGVLEGQAGVIRQEQFPSTKLTMVCGAFLAASANSLFRGLRKLWSENDSLSRAGLSKWLVPVIVAAIMTGLAWLGLTLPLGIHKPPPNLMSPNHPAAGYP